MLEFLEEGTNPENIKNLVELRENESRAEFAAIYCIILKEQGRINSEQIQLYNKIVVRYLNIIAKRFMKNPYGD